MAFPRLLTELFPLVDGIPKLGPDFVPVDKCIDLGSVSGTVSLDTTSGRVFSVTATGALTINVSELAPGLTILLILSGGGSHAVTWGLNPKWSGGMAPALSGKDLIVFTCGPDGVWYGVQVSTDVQ